MTDNEMTLLTIMDNAKFYKDCGTFDEDKLNNFEVAIQGMQMEQCEKDEIKEKLRGLLNG